MEKISEWGLPVKLVGPGITQVNKKGTEDQLTGQVLYNRTEFNPTTGEELTIDDPMVVLRLNSLDKIPTPGENWMVSIPESPDPDAPLVEFALTPTKAMKFNRSLGYVILYIQKVVQI